MDVDNVIEVAGSNPLNQDVWNLINYRINNTVNCTVNHSCGIWSVPK